MVILYTFAGNASVIRFTREKERTVRIVLVVYLLQLLQKFQFRVSQRITPILEILRVVDNDMFIIISSVNDLLLMDADISFFKVYIFPQERTDLATPECCQVLELMSVRSNELWIFLFTLAVGLQKNLPVSVIMVTAANDLETFEAAMRLGAIDYLVKPFAYERFRLALEKFDEKTNALREGKVLNQNKIDRIVSGGEGDHEDSPKGIQERTKAMIIDCLASDGGWMAGEAITKKTGLSSVTVRRYMNHLAQEGTVTGKMNYETGGRPCMIYKIIVPDHSP